MGCTGISMSSHIHGNHSTFHHARQLLLWLKSINNDKIKCMLHFQKSSILLNSQPWRKKSKPPNSWNKRFVTSILIIFNESKLIYFCIRHPLHFCFFNSQYLTSMSYRSTLNSLNAVHNIYLVFFFFFVFQTIASYFRINQLYPKSTLTLPKNYLQALKWDVDLKECIPACSIDVLENLINLPKAKPMKELNVHPHEERRLLDPHYLSYKL